MPTSPGCCLGLAVAVLMASCWWSTAAPVNVPSAMTRLFEVADAVMTWKCAVPGMAGRGAAAGHDGLMEVSDDAAVSINVARWRASQWRS
jgi:hypothetical protein